MKLIIEIELDRLDDGADQIAETIAILEGCQQTLTDQFGWTGTLEGPFDDTLLDSIGSEVGILQITE